MGRKRIANWMTRGAELGLVVASLALALLGSEAGLRLWLDAAQQASLPHVGIAEALQSRLAWLDWQQREGSLGTTSYPSSFDVSDPVLGWRVRANAQVRHSKRDVYAVDITTNEFGLRGTAPRAIDKPPGTTRIGVFGCSQTFGETVDDGKTYVDLLNKRLVNAEVLNFGVRGYGTDQMLLRYEQEAKAYDFDVVVIGFAFYHIGRNASSFLFYAKPHFSLLPDGSLSLNGTPVPAPEQLQAEDVSGQTWRWADRSVLLRWSWQRLRNFQGRKLLAADGQPWLLTKALLERFATSARTHGSKVVLVNIDESRPELEGELGQLADRLGVGLVNLGPVLRTAAASGVPYALPNDNHWTALGHEIVTDELLAYLCGAANLVSCGVRQTSADTRR
jgi:hypothetical protein